MINMITCEFCSRQFKPRGIKLHTNRCAAAKDARRRHHLRLPVNADALEHILSFLSNQSQTKLQAATGDRYQGCVPHLAQVCCRCENDNPATHRGLCLECDSRTPGFTPLFTTTEVRKTYGVSSLSGVPYEPRYYYTLFKRRDVEDHLIKLHGSKKAWVRFVAARAARIKKLAATKEANRKLHIEIMRGLSPECRTYLLHFAPSNPNAFRACANRFETLTCALRSRGLALQPDSSMCREFVLGVNADTLDDVVDTMEELQFLQMYTEYTSLCAHKINLLVVRDDREWIDLAAMDKEMKAIREDARRTIQARFSRAGFGTSLPRKWTSKL